MQKTAIQDQIGHNFCFGCGVDNPDGLQIKSFWDERTGESVCLYQPQAHQAAGPRHILNGGIIATLIDCHCVCTATGSALKKEGAKRSRKWFVTGSLKVKYLKPTPIRSPVELRAKIIEETSKKTVVECSLTSNGELCATGEVVAVKVPPSWLEEGSPDH